MKETISDPNNTIWDMRIVPLKKDKEYRPEDGNFRPIAIMNGDAKMLELATLHKINEIEYVYQHGFTKNKSTATAMVDLVTKLEITPKEKPKIFVDFSDAYNTVNTEKIMET